jgi:hypothetical protein
VRRRCRRFNVGRVVVLTDPPARRLLSSPRKVLRISICADLVSVHRWVHGSVSGAVVKLQGVTDVVRRHDERVDGAPTWCLFICGWMGESV